MSQLLVDTPSGVQEVIVVAAGGGYFDPARVIWDERIDGPLGEIQIGGMVRAGGELVFSAERMAEHRLAAAPGLEDYDRALTDHLDAVAQQRRWDSRVTCALRAGFPGPWQAEGIAFASWMDQCNAQAIALLADVEAGNVPQPTIEDFIAGLPTMVWPE